jgi:hypothetical protein
MTNLVEFWSVQPASGQNPHIFLSEKEAMEQSLKWRKAVEEEFAAWERGESNSSIVSSSIEGDGFGECVQTFSVASHSLPGGIYHHPVGTQSAEKWEDCPGCKKIVWGNPAH